MTFVKLNVEQKLIINYTTLVIMIANYLVMKILFFRIKGLFMFLKTLMIRIIDYVLVSIIQTLSSSITLNVLIKIIKEHN